MLPSELDAIFAGLAAEEPEHALCSLEKIKKEGSSTLSPRLRFHLESAITARDFFLRDVACELLLEFNGVEALPAVFEASLHDLGDDQDTISFLVGELLSSQPSAAKPIVINYLLDSRPEARAMATWALGFLNDPEIIPHLRAGLTDSAPEVRAQALGALGAYSNVPDVLELLLAGLTDGHVDVRLNAVSALGYSRNHQALMPLLKALDDGEPGVRRHAAYGLGQLGFYEAVDRLQQAASTDDDPQVQQEASKAVNRIRSLGSRTFGG